MSTDILIRTENVKKLYMMGHEEVWALKGVTLDIHRGEFLSIMGPSGSGKSTFFNQVGALDVPTEGKVFFENLHPPLVERAQVAVVALPTGMVWS
jgi:putative ABC transport system ATP-binding protein